MLLKETCVLEVNLIKSLKKTKGFYSKRTENGNGNNGNGKRKMETENGQKIDIRHW